MIVQTYIENGRTDSALPFYSGREIIFRQITKCRTLETGHDYSKKSKYY